MFGMGPEKILLLALVVLLLFGAKRLPEMGASFGKGIKEFKKSLGDEAEPTASRSELRDPSRDVPPAPARPAQSDAEWQPRRLGS